MRLYFKLTKNKEIIPFNYQHLLTGALHKWLGEENKEHGKLSLYSFSWIQNTRSNQGGITLTSDSYFFISAYDEKLIKLLVSGILEDPYLFNGVFVRDVQIMQTPNFNKEQKFFLGSPIFIKRRKNGKENHILFKDEKSDKYLTETLQKKLALVGLTTDGLKIKFDLEYPNGETKLVNYKGIQNRASMCPVIIKGSEEQIGFAWDVGIGNSTGIGFGSLK